MNLFVIFAIGTFLFPLFLGSYLHVSTIDDLALNKNSSIYAGKGEVCITPYSQIYCKTGLKCVLTSTKPHLNGICLPENKSLEKNYLDMYDAQANKSSIYYH